MLGSHYSHSASSSKEGSFSSPTHTGPQRVEIALTHSYHQEAMLWLRVLPCLQSLLHLPRVNTTQAGTRWTSPREWSIVTVKILFFSWVSFVVVLAHCIAVHMLMLTRGTRCQRIGTNGQRREAWPPSFRDAETGQETTPPLFPPLLRTQRAGRGAAVSESDRKHIGIAAFSCFGPEQMKLTQIFSFFHLVCR